MRLALRRGTVTAAEPAAGGMQKLQVEIGGERRPAVGDVEMVGEAAVGDDVVVNVAARDLKLGSGGFDIVHVNLTRGLEGDGVPGAHVMKLNYTSLQHAVLPVEGERLALPVGRPAAVFFLHGQLPAIAFAFAAAARGSRPLGIRPRRIGRPSRRPAGARLGYVQTGGGALPGALSEAVGELRARGLLAGHLTAGTAYGGEGEAISTAGAIHHGLTELGWDAAAVGPGPGILGSASALGHGGMAALDSAHTALALGCRTVVVPRMSEGDPRERHQGLSHHAATVLRLLLAPVTVPLPEAAPRVEDERHRWVRAAADLDAYRASGLPATTMGRSLEEDPLFFAAALAGGAVLAGLA
jgi:Protein of unknown function (DUF3866)